jgi:hypothetical protein
MPFGKFFCRLTHMGDVFVGGIGILGVEFDRSKSRTRVIQVKIFVEAAARRSLIGAPIGQLPVCKRLGKGDHHG